MKEPKRAKRSGQRGAGTPRVPRVGRARQRQHLIDACISALHRHGPSKTTVEKVVAIANLSPGIVRFYFDSKDAMLVASLEFLANEFADQLVAPVAALRGNPVAALDHLVDLYLGPQLASPRKVSVWYSFWGEATSRQEYYEICGARDAQFEALVRDIVGDLVSREQAPHLDVDGITLGLIGSLEIIWQGYAFQSETTIDRAAARSRIDAYLRSVFPRSFGQRPSTASPTNLPSARLPGTLPPGWAYAGRTEEFPTPGASLAVETPWGPLLVTRTNSGDLRAMSNRCPVRSHPLVTAVGVRQLDRLACALHGLTFDPNGEPSGIGHPPLPSAALCTSSGALIWVGPSGLAPAPSGSALVAAAKRPVELGERRAREVRAAWTVILEHWLGGATTWSDSGAEVELWDNETWTARRFRAIAADCDTPHLATYVAPTHLVESGPAGLYIHSIVAEGSDRSRWITTHHPVHRRGRRARVLEYLTRRRLRMERSLAETIQADIAAGTENPPVAALAALDRFRRARADLHSISVDTTGAAP